MVRLSTSVCCLVLFLTGSAFAQADSAAVLGTVRDNDGQALGGATVAGAFEVLPRPYSVATFDNPRAAFEWAAPAHRDDGPGLLDRRYAEATGTPLLLGELRAYLEGHLTSAEVAGAATALAMSPRTLQRKLAEAQTTFKRELADARIRVAKRKLVETDAPLTAIAFDVGCASLQHFSALFRRTVRESPSAFRARARG